MKGIVEEWAETVRVKTRLISPQADYYDIYDEQFDELKKLISNEIDKLLSQESYGKEPTTDLTFVYSKKDLKDLKQTLLQDFQKKEKQQ